MAPEPDPRRLEFQAILEALGGSDIEAVYFQPGPNVVMKKPCIVYERDNASTKSADNLPYLWRQRYQVTIISQDPDNPVIKKLTALPLSSYSRHFATSDLNHDVVVIYY